MSDYINKAQAVAQAIAEIESLGLEVGRELERRIKNDYISQPTADVVEVRHGRWERVEGLNLTCRCQICGWLVGYAQSIAYAYCPNCGAKMDGEEQEN